MSRVITVRLTKFGLRTGPRFDVFDNFGNQLGKDVPKSALISGVTYEVGNNVTVISISSLNGCIGNCFRTINIPITPLTKQQIAAIKPIQANTASIWRHLTNTLIYNSFYGVTEPYILEHPFAYQYHDEILQNVKDYSKVFKYLPSVTGVFNNNERIEIDDAWFNKAILYNGQQCSGMLNLVKKPMNNLSEYVKYPTYSDDGKTITYTKSDNFYQYNTFWSLVKSKSTPLFVNSCCNSMSLDKELNQSNMDYGKRSFKKEPLRAKDLRVRHILDNRSDVHIVSQLIFAPTMISYK